MGRIAGVGQAQGRHKPPQARPGESGAFISTLPVFTPELLRIDYFWTVALQAIQIEFSIA